MNVLVLNGSPKKDMSDTMQITKAFLAGMDEITKNDITVIHTVEKNIQYCRGCFTCMRGDGKCVIDDDMKEILTRILECDILLLNFPLYCYGMPASLKAVIDRILPLSKMTMQKVGDTYEHECRNDYSKKRYIMICGCGFPNTKNTFEAAEMHFRMMFASGGTILTVPESPLFNIPDAKPVTDPFLALIKQAGREYMQLGDIAPDTRKKLAIPMIPEAEYARMVNETVQ